MTYTYKLGNNGPIAEVDDDIKIVKESYKEGGKGMFGGPDEWSLNLEKPGSFWTVKITKGTGSSNGIKFTW